MGSTDETPRSVGEHGGPRPTSLWASIAGLALAAPFLVWFAIGDQSTGDDYAYGPYDVGSSSEYVVIATALLALVAVGALARLTRRGRASRLWWAVAVLLVAAASVAAAGWRVSTAGVGGANIGAGFVFLAGPPLVALVLLMSVGMAHLASQTNTSSSGGEPWYRRRGIVVGEVAAILVAPVLYVLLWRLGP